MIEVIIPSAKIVPEELRNLGNLPAVIYPVNQRIVFDYLYEQYSDAKFKVIAFENEDKIRKRLASYKRTEVITLCHIADLAYSIKAGLSNEDIPTVINFGDTILFNDITEAQTDCYYYAEDDLSKVWTFFEEEDGIITSIIDKQNVSGGKGKLFCGVFKILHPTYLSQCIDDAERIKDKECSCFYYALQLYSHKYPLKPIFTSDWLDIGHADKYYESQIEVKAREFNQIQIDKDRGLLTKSSKYVDKFLGEIRWYLKLPKDIEYVRPRIFDYSTEYENPFVTMEYYAYHTLHELYIFGELSKKQWRDIFRRIHFVYSDFQRYCVEDSKIVASLEEMYLSKTIQRFETIKRDMHFMHFYDFPITVNGLVYESLNSIISRLKDKIPQFLYNIERFHIIHGDLCFSNIMIDNNLNFIKVVDPRGRFGAFDIYGDSRYELAKILHSLDGKYDYIIKDMFSVTYNIENAEINYTIHDRNRGYDLCKMFLDEFDKEIGSELSNIYFIEALLFMSMIPLHAESIDHQMVMLGTGLEILNRVIDIKRG